MTVTATDQPTGGSTVGTIVGSPAVFNGGDNAKTVAFDPAAAGASLIEVVHADRLQLQHSGQRARGDGNRDGADDHRLRQTVGRDLQIQGQLFLGTPTPTAAAVDADQR